MLLLQKLPNHGSSKQIVCSSTPGGRSERLKALCTLAPPDTCVAISPAALEAKEGAFLALEEEDGSGIHGATTYQVGLERTEQAYVAESW